MPVSAKIRITQYGTVEGEYTEQHLPSSLSCINTFVNGVGSTEGIHNFYHLKDVVNPKPVSGGHTDYYVTDDPDNQWSDSPTNAPSLSDTKRYGYGRFGTRYGKLDNFVGVVIHNSDFSKEGEYLVQNHSFSGSQKIYHLDNELSSDLGMYHFATPEGEVAINQYIFALLASPVPFSYKNPVDTNVSIRLSNYTYPLDSTTLELYLDGEKKETSSTPFYGGLGGFDFIWYNDENFEYNTQVNVEWRIYDTASTPNLLVFKYWFRTIPDLIGPRISSFSPEDDEVGVSVDTCVSFRLRDYESGVNLNSIELYVNNQLVDINGPYVSVSILSTLDGYEIIYCPPKNFLYGDEIPVSLYVEDSADEPNYLFYTYSFTTEESAAPRVVGANPHACRKYKPITVDVEVDIVDGGAGLDDASILFSVDDEAVNNPRKLPIIYREE